MLIKQILKNKLYAMTLMFITVVTTSNVFACEAKIQSLQLQQSGNNNYDVFSSNAYALTQQYEVKVLFTNVVETELCQYYLIVSPFNHNQNLTSVKNESLTFEAISQSSTGGVKNNSWYGAVSPDNNVFRFQLRFPSKQFASRGSYESLLETKLTASLSSSDIVDELQQNISAYIDSAAQISFYGISNNSYDLDLGTLTTGKVIDASPNLYIKSTTNYSLSFESKYRGKLRHENQQQKWDIDYKLVLNNAEIDLNLENKQSYTNAATTSNGVRLPLRIVVGDTEQKAGGIYSDEIHIYISPSGLDNL